MNSSFAYICVLRVICFFCLAKQLVVKLLSIILILLMFESHSFLKSSGYSYPAHVEVTTTLVWNLPTEIGSFMELLLWENDNNNHFSKPVQNVILSFGCVKKSDRPYFSFSSLKINCESSSGSLIQSLCLFYLHYILACSGNKTDNLPHIKTCLISYKTTFCSLFPVMGGSQHQCRIAHTEMYTNRGCSENQIYDLLSQSIMFFQAVYRVVRIH